MATLVYKKRTFLENISISASLIWLPKLSLMDLWSGRTGLRSVPDCAFFEPNFCLSPWMSVSDCTMSYFNGAIKTELQVWLHCSRLTGAVPFVLMSQINKNPRGLENNRQYWRKNAFKRLAMKIHHSVFCEMVIPILELSGQGVNFTAVFFCWRCEYFCFTSTRTFWEQKWIMSSSCVYGSLRSIIC